MRRMYTEKQVRELADEEVAGKVVESLAGKDISIEGLTSKGIANTGGLANIGNVAISGELSVSGAINGEENPSVKPIYCHAITINNSTQQIKITCLIFNNSPTPLTAETLVDFIDELYLSTGANVRIMVSGYYKSNVGSLLPCIASYIGKSPDNYFIQGCSVDGTFDGVQYVQFSKTNFVNALGTITDGVNKIN